MSNARSGAALAAPSAFESPRLAVQALMDRRFEDALTVAESRLESGNSHALDWHDHATALASLGRWDAAVPSFERACLLAPSEPRLALSLAQALIHTRNFVDARANLAAALQLGAPSEKVAYRLAQLAFSEGDFPAAEELLRTLVNESAASPHAHRLLGHVLIAQEREAESSDHWRVVVAADPSDTEAKSILASLCWNDGDLAECLSLCEELLATGQLSPQLHSFYLSSLLHDDERSASEVRLAHEGWFALHAAAIHPFPSYPNTRNPIRRLRLAYLGGDFHDNPSYYFLIPLFQHHCHDNFEIFAYDIRGSKDWARADFASHADCWRDVSTLTDEQIVRQIRRDEIDILIDTTGHYEGHRARVFTAKPAPLQFAYPNYPGTTGQRHTTGIVSDRWVCPPGSEDQYTEKPFRLTAGCLPYMPPRQAPPVSPLPALRNGFVTFGLFQRPAKISESCWNAVASILRSLPTSRLLIHNSFATLEDPASRIRQNFIRSLGDRGISAERLIFAGPTAMLKHLDILSAADIALDSFPYNGQTTTCECLWMGIPVISLTGSFHVNRVGHMLLCRVGKPAWSAPNPDSYVQKALGLASHISELAHIRAQLRPAMAASSLVDGATITSQLETAIRASWIEWCASAG